MTDQEFLAAIAKGDNDAVKAALDDGTDADVRDEYGNTALMIACARGRREICKALLNAGANVNHRNRYGLGPKDWLTWSDDNGIRNMLG